MTNLFETFCIYSKSANAIIINESVCSYQLTNEENNSNTALLNIAQTGMYPVADSNLAFDVETSQWTITNEDKTKVSFTFIKFDKHISPDLTQINKGSTPLSADLYNELVEYLKEQNLLTEASKENIEHGELDIDVDYLKSKLDNNDDLINEVVDQITNIISKELSNEAIFKHQFTRYSSIVLYC